MKISTDIYAFCDAEKLLSILESNPHLKVFADHEASRTADNKPPSGCGGGCGGCGGGGCGGCKSSQEEPDPSYLTTALISIFNYYIPDDIKDALHMGAAAFIED